MIYERLSPVENPNILRRIPDWRNFFEEYSQILRSRQAMVAQGGTVDGVATPEGLVPIYHPVNIPYCRNLNAAEIASEFFRLKTPSKNLGEQYIWTAGQENIPWIDIEPNVALWISSFDSGKEEEKHFTAGLWFDFYLLRHLDEIFKTKGTDSQVEQAVLNAIVLGRFLMDQNKRETFAGSPEPGTVPGSLAISQITAGLYTNLEEKLWPAVYLVSPERHKDGSVENHIFPALGSVKLNADGYFYAPNTGPLITIKNNVVILEPLYEVIKSRVKYFSLLPDFSKVYLEDRAGCIRLQHALEAVSIETVKNPSRVLDLNYEAGHRVFVVKARGTGNATDGWKEKIEEIIKKGDTTVMVITLADSGDVDLKKYEAGLNVVGVLSGRTLREDAAWILAGIIHDLKINNQLSMDPQSLINLFCYLSGMIDLSGEELNLLATHYDNNSESHMIYPTS